MPKSPGPSYVPALERIGVPALVCASFSDQGLHTRGSFEGFRRVGSRQRFLYTHRGGKWSTYYSPDALSLQARFFECFLKGDGTALRHVPPVRLEIRARGDEVHALREEQTWPPRSVRWVSLYLAPSELRATPADRRATLQLDLTQGALTFDHPVAQDMEVVGPMKLRLHVQLVGATDAHLFVAISKVERARDGHGGREIYFEGTSGFGCDVVAKGWQRLAHRRVDESRGEPHRPFHLHDRAEPVRAGEVVPVDVEILPSATYFARGDTLRLGIQGRWFWRRSMFRGMFPFTYAPSPGGKLVLHVGENCDAHLLAPQV